MIHTIIFKIRSFLPCVGKIVKLSKAKEDAEIIAREIKEKESKNRVVDVSDIFSSPMNQYKSTSYSVYAPVPINSAFSLQKSIVDEVSEATTSSWTSAYCNRTEEKFPEDSLAEMKMLFQSMVIGMKAVISTLSALQRNATAGVVNARIAPSLLPSESLYLEEFLRYGIQCLSLYYCNPKSTIAVQTARGAEQKDIITAFANSFSFLHPINFRNIFAPNIDFLFDLVCILVSFFSI